MSMAAYRIHSMVVNNVPIACESQNLDMGIEPFAEMGGASTIASISGEKQQKPMFTGTTKDAKALLDAVTLSGLALTGSGNSKVLVYLAKFADGVGFVAHGAGIHKLVTITKGLIVINSISARGNDPATVSFSVYAVYDGTNAPFLMTGGIDNADITLPATPQRLTALWTTGPVSALYSLAGETAIAFTVESQGATIDLGPDVYVGYKDGSGVPELACVQKYNMAVTIDTLDALALTRNAAISSLIIYFRKANPNSGGRVANATATHFSFTIAAGYVYPGAGGLNFPSPAGFQNKIIPIYDGTNAAIVMNTATAIS